MEKPIRYKRDTAARLCNAHDFKSAEPILHEIVSEDHTQSDAWQLLATVDWFGNKDIDRAYDELIESLKQNPKNINALLLMGNLLNIEKDDLTTAKEYYEKALEYEPNNTIALNNIGGIYMKQKMYNDAIDYFQKAMDADKTFPNSYYGMALCMKAQARNVTAFDICVDGMKNAVDRPENSKVKKQIENLLMQQADILYGMTDFTKQIETFRKLAEDFDEHQVLIQMKPTLSDDNNVILEYRICNQRDFTVIWYKEERPNIQYSVIKVLIYLMMLITEVNADKEKKIKYSYTPYNFQAEEESAQAVANFAVDLLIEHRIYNSYVGLRPAQLLNFKFNSHRFSVSPAERVLSIVSSMQFRDFYGFNNTRGYKPTEKELEQATNLYNAYKDCVNGYHPGDEYELIEYFIKTLQDTSVRVKNKP